jgi:hypothetical protein
MTAFPSYSTGTVSVNNGDTVIVGDANVIWSETNARAGDDIVIAGHTVIVQDVIDTTHLAIDAWPYANVPAGTAYKILQRSPLRYAGGQTAADVIALVAALKVNGFYVFVPPDAITPDPSLGEDSQYGFQATTGKLWHKLGGLWIFVGVYRGWSQPKPWDAVTTWNPFDVAEDDGSSYFCIAQNTNQRPPNATFWQLVASKGGKGDKGTKGDDGAPGVGYGGTSTTSLTIGAGAQTFATQAGLAYTVGARVRLSSGSNFMEGVLTAYAGTSMTVNVDKVGGTGTFNAWTLNIAGQPGTPQGQQQRFIFTAVAGQTTFSGADDNGATLAYTPGSVEVADNGFWVPYPDYTATDGTSLVLSSPSKAGDKVYLFALSAFNPADTLAKSANGGDIQDKPGFLNTVSALGFGAAQSLTGPQQNQVQKNAGLPAIMRSYLAGLTLSTAGGSGTFGVATGVAADSTNVDMLTLAAAFTKTNGNWVAGIGNGSIDVGTAVPSTWYHVFLIKNLTTQAVDVLTSLSATAPTLPSGYTLFRRIGSLRTNGSNQWTAFTQNGDEFLWTTPVNDVNSFPTSAALSVFTLSVPTGVKVSAKFIGLIAYGSGTNVQTVFSSPDAPYTSSQVPGFYHCFVTAQEPQAAADLTIRTNTSAQVINSSSGAGGSVFVGTSGWIDRRGKDN